MVRMVIGIGLLLMCLLGALVQIFAPPLPAAREQRAPASVARMAVATATVGEVIVVAGGIGSDGQASPVVEEYDPRSDTWRMSPSLPLPVAMAAAAELNGVLYVAGGRNDDTVLGSVFALETRSGTWRQVGALPEPRWGLALAALNGRIYAIGGVAGTGSERQTTARVDAFDPASGQWTPAAALPEPKHSAAVAVHEGRIYLLGGRSGVGDSGKAVKSVHVYEPGRDRWTPGGQMLMARAGAAAAVAEGRIFAAGGSAQGGASAEIVAYDPATQRWSYVGTSLGKGRTGHGMAAWNGRLFVIGGAESAKLAGILADAVEIVVAPGALARSSRAKEESFNRIMGALVFFVSGVLLVWSGWRARAAYRAVVTAAQAELAATGAIDPSRLAAALKRKEKDVRALLQRAVGKGQIAARDLDPGMDAARPASDEPPPLERQTVELLPPVIQSQEPPPLPPKK